MTRFGICISTSLALATGLAARAPADPSFTDVTSAAGVDYLQYEITVPPLASEPAYMSGGAAAADYDRDGCVDLFVTRLDETDLLFRNKCDGTFEDVSAGAGFTQVLPTNGAAWGDIDNDGDPDLYVTTLNHTRYYLYMNLGNGQFVEKAVARGAALEGTDDHFGYSPTFGDYDRDGWLDLFVGEWRRDSFTPPGTPSRARLLRNLGEAGPGFFEDTTVAAGVALEGISGTQDGVFPFTPRFSDLDGDGWQDLAISSDFSESCLFWNDGDGTFTEGTVASGVGTDENGMGNAIGDYDGDGRLDWFVTSVYDPDDMCATLPCGWGDSGNRLYRNEGNRTFSDQTDAAGVRDGYWGWGAAFWDYDNDADLDIVMVNGADFAFVPPGHPLDGAFDRFLDDPMRLWRNEGGGPMTELSASVGLTDTRSGKGLLVFDYDRDGDLDLFIANNAEHPVLYRNDGGNANDWLRVKTRGYRTNRDGVGAVVEMTATSGGPTQVREIGVATQFLGQSELVAHFGLGPASATPVHEVKVTWPASGKVKIYTDVARNQTLFAFEPHYGCGLLGIECLPLLAGLAWRRRRRARG